MGVNFNETGKDNVGIKQGIVQARRPIGSLNSILWSKEMTKVRKFRIYETIIDGSLFYGPETWRITEKYMEKIEAVENFP